MAIVRNKFNFLLVFFYLGLLFFRLWKCRFGIDLYDEPFFLLPALKLQGLGDRMFFEEVGGSFRQFDLINSLFIKPFVPFSLLELRQVATVLSFGSLLWFTHLCFGTVLSTPALLTFIPCFFLDGGFSFSHYYWLRFFILVHLCLLLLSQKGKKSELLLFLSGTSLGLAIVSYYPVVISPIAVTGAIVILSIFSNRFAIVRNKKQVRQLVLYSLGWVVVFSMVLLFNLLPKNRQGWFAAVSIIANLPDYRHDVTIASITTGLGDLISKQEFWFVLVVAFFLKSKRATKIPHQRMILACLIGILAYLCTYNEPVYEYLPKGFFLYYSMAFIGGILFLIDSIRRKELNQVLFWCPCFFLFICVMLVASRSYFIIWVIPFAFIPFIASIHSSKSLAMGKSIVYLCLISLVVRFSYFQYRNTFYDVPVADVTTRLEMAPLKGIYTSPRRAFLLETVNRLVADKKYVLGLGGIPFIYYFGNVRSAHQSTILYPRTLPRLERIIFNYLIETERLPELLIRSKAKLVTWGGENVPEEYYDTDAFIHFTSCAGSRRILDLPEFEAWELNPQKIKSCLRAAVVYTLLIDKDLSWIENLN